MAVIDQATLDELADYDSDDGYRAVKKDPHEFQLSRSLKRLVENAKEYRSASKYFMANLPAAAGAPGTTKKVDLIEKRWTVYWNIACRQGDKVPTIDDVCRFLHNMAHTLEPQDKGKKVMSYSTFTSMAFLLVKLLQFKYRPHYTVYSVDAQVIHHTLDQLTKDGKLFKGTWQKRTRVGFHTIRKILRSWFASALVEGTMSWDRTIMFATAFALQYALGCRSGEIAQSNGYKEDEYLCWRDVEIKLTKTGPGLPSIQDLQCVITLRAVKNYKDRKNENHELFFAPLPQRANNIADPIKLLLILALRLGYVHGTTIDQVLRHTASIPDAIVQWKKPDSPVLCSLTSWASLGFNLDKPLCADSHLKRVKLMAKTVGLREQITSHSLRRGAMQDLANTEVQPHAISDASAAVLAGHSSAVRERGITRQYIGDTEEDLFAIRVEKPFVSKRAPLVPIPPAAIYNTLHISPGHGMVLQAPKGIAGNDKDNGIDVDVEGFQLSELDTMMTGRVDNIISAEESVTDMPPSCTTQGAEQDVIMHSDATTLVQSNDDCVLVEEIASAFCSDTVSAAQPDLDMLVNSEQDDPNPPPASHITNTDDILDGDFDEFVGFFSRINAFKTDKRLATDSICGNSREQPQQFTFTCGLCSKFSTTNEKSFELHVKRCAAKLDPTIKENLIIPKRAGTKRTSRNSKPRKKKSGKKITTNPVDDSACGKEAEQLLPVPLSCQLCHNFSSTSRDLFADHVRNCWPVQLPSPAQSVAQSPVHSTQSTQSPVQQPSSVESDSHTGPKLFFCKRPDCNASYTTLWRLNDHMLNHDWVPRPCEKCYDKSVLYNTRNEYQKHMKQHNPLPRVRCPISTCPVKVRKPDQDYEKEALRHHLNEVHDDIEKGEVNKTVRAMFPVRPRASGNRQRQSSGSSGGIRKVGTNGQRVQK